MRSCLDYGATLKEQLKEKKEKDGEFLLTELEKRRTISKQQKDHHTIISASLRRQRRNSLKMVRNISIIARITSSSRGDDIERL